MLAIERLTLICTMIGIRYPMSNKKDTKPLNEGLGIEHTLLRAAEGAIGPCQTFGN